MKKKKFHKVMLTSKKFIDHLQSLISKLLEGVPKNTCLLTEHCRDREGNDHQTYDNNYVEIDVDCQEDNTD